MSACKFLPRFRECTEGWNFQVQGNFEAASPPLDFSSHHFLTVQQHSHFKHTIWTCSKLNLQPSQTSTLVSESLPGTQMQGCAVVTPTKFFSSAEAPSGQPRQTKALLRLPSPAVWCHWSGTTGAPTEASAALACWLIHHTIFTLSLPTGEALVNKGRAVILQSVLQCCNHRC